MAKELDNIKMLESILDELPESELTDAIASALGKQGFRYNGKHIVPIEEKMPTCSDISYCDEQTLEQKYSKAPSKQIEGTLKEIQ